MCSRFGTLVLFHRYHLLSLLPSWLHACCHCKPYLWEKFAKTSYYMVWYQKLVALTVRLDATVLIVLHRGANVHVYCKINILHLCRKSICDVDAHAVNIVLKSC